MARTVTYGDIDLANHKSTSVSTADVELIPSRLGRHRRKQLLITNTSATTVTVVKGEGPATAGTGIRLTQGQTYIEADDAGFSTWQGPVHAIASAASTVVHTETIEA